MKRNKESLSPVLSEEKDYEERLLPRLSQGRKQTVHLKLVQKFKIMKKGMGKHLLQLELVLEVQQNRSTTRITSTKKNAEESQRLK